MDAVVPVRDQIGPQAVAHGTGTECWASWSLLHIHDDIPFSTAKGFYTMLLIVTAQSSIYAITVPIEPLVYSHPFYSYILKHPSYYSSLQISQKVNRPSSHVLSHRSPAQRVYSTKTLGSLEHLLAGFHNTQSDSVRRLDEISARLAETVRVAAAR